MLCRAGAGGRQEPPLLMIPPCDALYHSGQRVRSNVFSRQPESTSCYAARDAERLLPLKAEALRPMKSIVTLDQLVFELPEPRRDILQALDGDFC